MRNRWTKTALGMSVVAAVVVTGVMVTGAAGPNEPPPKIAFVARGDGSNFADALAVGSVAGQLGAPVFTTNVSSLPAETAAALVDYDPDLVVITGGPMAVSTGVESAIVAATGLASNNVIRVAGDNRYGTAAAIAELFEELDVNPAFLGIADTAADSHELGGIPASEYALIDDLAGLLPTAVITVDPDGDLRNSSWGPPATGAPTVNHLSTGSYQITIPGVSFDIANDVAVCSRVGVGTSSAGLLTVDSSTGRLIVQTFTSETPGFADAAFTCTIHAQP